jgi:hypothetical protein
MKSSAAPHERSTFRVSSASARVRPRFTAAMGLPAAANRYPEYTISEDPTTSMASARARPAIAAATRSVGTLSPKNTTSGFSTPPQTEHAGTSNESKVEPLEIRVAVGRFAGLERVPIRIAPRELQLEGLSIEPPLASGAADAVDAAVQIDDRDASGRLVQPIDVLRHEQLDAVAPLEPRERAMRLVGMRGGRSTWLPGPGSRAARPGQPWPLPFRKRAKSGLVAVKISSTALRCASVMSGSISP